MFCESKGKGGEGKRIEEGKRKRSGKERKRKGNVKERAKGK
jgi:hypothetical protein